MGAAVAAIIIRREKELAELFVQHRATSATTAQSLDVLRVEHDRIFQRLEDRAVIRQGPNGSYYLDEPSWNAMRSTRQRTLVVVFLIAALLLSYIYITTNTRRAASETSTTQSNS